MQHLRKQLFYIMNPNKFRACEYLIRKHEKRGDKIIVFSDNIFALKTYAAKLRRHFVCGPTPNQERLEIFHHFKHKHIIFQCIREAKYVK